MITPVVALKGLISFRNKYNSPLYTEAWRFASKPVSESVFPLNGRALRPGNGIKAWSQLLNFSDTVNKQEFYVSSWLPMNAFPLEMKLSKHSE